MPRDDDGKWNFAPYFDPKRGKQHLNNDIEGQSKLCERTLVMCRGRVVEEGLTKQVLSEPAEDYTRRLIDAVPRPGWVPRRSAAAV